MFFPGTAKKWLNNPCHQDLSNTYPICPPRSLPKACYIWLVAFKNNQSSLDGCFEKGIIVLSRATEPRKPNIVSISTNPYQGLKPLLVDMRVVLRFVPISTNPYQGLKPAFQFLRIPIRD